MGISSGPIVLNETFWTQIAAGAASVTFTPTETVAYVINNANTQPTIQNGHVAERSRDKSLALLANEYLFVKGKGTLMLTVS